LASGKDIWPIKTAFHQSLEVLEQVEEDDPWGNQLTEVHLKKWPLYKSSANSCVLHAMYMYL